MRRTTREWRMQGLLLALGLAVAQVGLAQEPPTGHVHQHEQAPAEPPAQVAEPAGEAMPELSGEPISLAELEGLAAAHNPEIAQAEAEIRVALGLKKQVGLYPNPTIGYAAEEIPLERGRDGGKQGGFIAQPIVIGGKRRLNREIFEQEVERARAIEEAVRLRELNRVRILYYRAAAAQRLVELRARLAELAREAVGVTTQLYNTGAADRPDQLAIEIEAETAALELAAAQRELEQLWEQLASAVGDPELRPRPLADTLDAELPSLPHDETLGTILDVSPEVRFTRAGLARAELALKREKVEPIPNLELTAGVLDNREPVVPGGPAVGRELFGDVGVRIPLFNRNQGNVAAAAAEVERARAEVERVRLKLAARFAPVFAAYRQEGDTVDRYRQRILGRAEEAYQLQARRYRQMAAAYPQVLIARRTWFQAQTAYVASLGRLWESVVLLRGMLLSEEPMPAILEDAVVRRTPREAGM